MYLTNPRISIGLPVYNGERYLAEAIESILAQTMTDFELVISDNASTDATEQICRRFMERDDRVRYLRSDRNIGANANFNRALKFSNPRSRYFRWAAHDDVLAPTCLEKCATLLDSDPVAVLCHSRTRLIDAWGHTLPQVGATIGGLSLPPRDPPRRLDSTYPQERFAEILLRTRWCFEIFGLIRRSSLLKTSLQEDFYGTDKVILSSLSLAGTFLEVPEELFFRRCHNQQSTAIRTVAARTAWSNPGAKRTPAVPQLPCLRGYIRAAKTADLFPRERAACLMVLSRYILQTQKLASLLSGTLQRRTAGVSRLPPTAHTPRRVKSTPRRPKAGGRAA